MEKGFYHEQLFGSESGIVFSQASSNDADNYDTEAELRCPACESAIHVADRCLYCNFDLIGWAISNMSQNASIEQLQKTMQEMRNGG